MFIALHEYEVRQHLVPHSSSVWSHEETTLTEHTFHWCWHSRCAEDPLEETMQDGELRLILHSFPWVSVMTKSQGYLRFWVRSPKQGLETFFQRPKPGRGLGIRDQGQGQGFNSRPRPRTLLAGLEAPRGQGHVLEDSNSEYRTYQYKNEKPVNNYSFEMRLKVAEVDCSQLADLTWTVTTSAKDDR